MSDRTADDLPTESESAAEAAPDPKDEHIAALEAEVTDLKDRFVRTLAEMENLRRRTQREVADARQYAVSAFARDVLTVSDNLRRAIDAVPEGGASGDPTLKALIEGVEMTERGLEQTLGKFGVKRIEPAGEKFDPDFHQAMFEVPTAEAPPGTVAQVVQAGYVIGERVLRPALVGVAKAPPQPAAADDDWPDYPDE